jgi:hypothetical protein
VFEGLRFAQLGQAPQQDVARLRSICNAPSACRSKRCTRGATVAAKRERRADRSAAPVAAASLLAR